MSELILALTTLDTQAQLFEPLPAAAGFELQVVHCRKVSCFVLYDQIVVWLRHY